MTPSSRALLRGFPSAAAAAAAKCRVPQQGARRIATSRSLVRGSRGRLVLATGPSSWSGGVARGRALCTGGAATQPADESDSRQASKDAVIAITRQKIRKELKVGRARTWIEFVNFELPPEDMGTAMKPQQMVDLLEEHIVGQSDAKRAVAIALRNRWRRTRLDEDMRGDVIPKNILMIGPTGCGKTEIARRVAKMSQAPFIKVEATKFTEVGFHGQDVDKIIKDLVEVGINMTKKKQMAEQRAAVKAKTEAILLECLVGTKSQTADREKFVEMLNKGELEDIYIKVPVNRNAPDMPGVIFSDNGSPNVPKVGHLQDVLQFRCAVVKSTANAWASVLGARAARTDDQALVTAFTTAHINHDMLKSNTNKRSVEQEMKVKDARPLIEDMEIEKRLDMAAVTSDAIKAVEETGIVFIDEIDKICNVGERRSADASAEGVQRDLLPMIEGSSVSTRHGNIDTSFILFIASGAFHSCKPSDMLAELQGRLPIRVQLKGLTESDLYKILTEPVNNLIRQQVELMKTEGVDIQFADEAIREIARVAAYVNKTVENIGARRLHTVLERIVEKISFEASEMEAGSVVEVDIDLVKERVSDMLEGSDLSKYII